MGGRRLIVALVGAIGLSLTVTPADALTSPVADRAGLARLVVGSCTPPVTGAVRVAVRDAWREVAARILAARHRVSEALDDAAGVGGIDVDAPVVATSTTHGASASAGSAVERTGVVSASTTHRAREVDVTAVNTATLGNAVAVAESHRDRDVDVTAVNTGTLGTAVAVATPSPKPAKSSKDVTGNVTAVNTGILGKAVAVGGGGNGNVTAINTGVLGTAIAVGGGGDVGYPIGL